MVTFHIPQIAPSSGGWVVLLFSNKTGAHAELFCCVVSVSFSLSFLFFFCLLEDGQSWRPDDSKLIRSQMEMCESTLSGSGLWVSRFAQPSWSVAFQTMHLHPRVFPVFFFSRHILIIKVPDAVRDTEYKRPYLKAVVQSQYQKEEVLPSTLPHPLICAYLPFRPCDMLFSFIATVWNWVQSDLLRR